MDRDIFCHDTNIIYWTSYLNICDTFTYASTNMGKHCLVLMHDDFPNKLTRKFHTEQCLALYSRWWTQQTDACFQLGLSAVQTCESTGETWGDWACYVMYHITYCIMTTVSGYVLYRGKMYHCRPTGYTQPTLVASTLMTLWYPSLLTWVVACLE